MLNKRTFYNNKMFLSGIMFSIMFCFVGILFPKKLMSFLSFLNDFILDKFGVFYLSFGLLIVLITLIIVFLPFSKKKNGRNKSRIFLFLLDCFAV